MNRYEQEQHEQFGSGRHQDRGFNENRQMQGRDEDQFQSGREYRDYDRSGRDYGDRDLVGRAHQDFGSHGGYSPSSHGQGYQPSSTSRQDQGMSGERSQWGGQAPMMGSQHGAPGFSGGYGSQHGAGMS